MNQDIRDDMMVGETQDADSVELLGAMRAAFDRRDWDETLSIYGRLVTAFAGNRGLRVEATCLASRAMVAKNDRPGGRSILKPIASAEYTKAVHYDFLARAFLDLKNYKETARVCERGAALIEAEAAATSSDTNSDDEQALNGTA